MNTKEFKIIETDNHDGDYPNETFLKLPLMTQIEAEALCLVINAIHCTGDRADRFWRVVKQDYVLQPGFEP